MANYNAPWNKGLVGVQRHSLDTKRKMSVSHTGTTKPEWVKEKIRDAQVGVPRLYAQGSKHYRWNPNKSEFLAYARHIRSLSDRTYREHIEVINPNNHKRTLCGVSGGYQLDHKISIKEGFENKIPVLDMSGINNLQLLPWRENSAKGA